MLNINSPQMKILDRITFNPEIYNGRPIIRGMRFRVQDVLEMMANGDTEEEILEEYPYLEKDDIKACLQFAANKLSHPVVHAA